MYLAHLIDRGVFGTIPPQWYFVRSKGTSSYADSNPLILLQYYRQPSKLQSHLWITFVYTAAEDLLAGGDAIEARQSNPPILDHKPFFSFFDNDDLCDETTPGEKETVELQVRSLGTSELSFSPRLS